MIILFPEVMNMDPSGADLVVTWYEDIESRLLNIIRLVPYTETNMKVVLPLLASIITETGSVIDTVFREQYENPPKDKKYLIMRDFAPFYERKLSLGSRKTLMYMHPLQYLRPFASWVSEGKYKDLVWWTNYNELKHNRVQEHRLSRLDNAVLAAAGLHELLAQLDTFYDALVRHGMVRTGGSNISYARENLRTPTPKISILVESELFASVRGNYSFPENPNKIQPYFAGESERLIRFLGRDH